MQALAYEECLHRKFDPLLKIKYPETLPPTRLESTHHYAAPSAHKDDQGSIDNLNLYRSSLPLLGPSILLDDETNDFVSKLSLMHVMIQFHQNTLTEFDVKTMNIPQMMDTVSRLKGFLEQYDSPTNLI